MIPKFAKTFKKIVALSTMAITLVTGTCNVTVMAATTAPSITYRAHVAEYGWLSYVSNGTTAGTTGQSRRMEATQINVSGINGGISYRAHVAENGWMNWVNSGQLAGTTGQSKRMEAIQIKLTGEAANTYDVVYRAHVADYGWMNWVKNGQTAGTTGEYRRMEALEIKLVKKNTTTSSVLSSSKVNSFITDSNWKVGTLFNNSVTGKLKATKNLGYGCNAYARDFVYYVYGKGLYSGTKYTSISEIRAGDTLYVTPQHWMVVLARNGNTLDIIHGNWTNGKVCRSNFTINGKNIGSKTFSYGYHY